MYGETDGGEQSGAPRLDEATRALTYLLMRLVLADVSLVRSAPRQGVPLSPQQVRAAIHLSRHEGLTVGELAEALGVSLGWASRIADELVMLGHVRRERDEQDRRVVRLRVTPEARAIAEGMFRRRAHLVTRALEPNTAAERAAIGAFFDRLAGELERAAGDGTARAPA